MHQNARVDKSVSFTFRFDTKKSQEITPSICLIAVLCLLAYSSLFDQIDELVKISEKSAQEFFERFASEVISNIPGEDLCVPGRNDLKRILQITTSKGFTECIRSWGCLKRKKDLSSCMNGTV